MWPWISLQSTNKGESMLLARQVDVRNTAAGRVTVECSTSICCIPGSLTGSVPSMVTDNVVTKEGWLLSIRVTDNVSALLVLHGEGRISPETPRNQNNDQPSRGQQQEAVQN